MVADDQFAVLVRPTVHRPAIVFTTDTQFGYIAFIVMFIDKGAKNFSGLIVVEIAFWLMLAKIDALDSLAFWFAFNVFRDGVEIIREYFGLHVAISDREPSKLCQSFDGGLHRLDLMVIKPFDVHTT